MAETTSARARTSLLRNAIDREVGLFLPEKR